MNILIMGDSWGKSNLEHCFLSNGHIVFNKSIYAGNNSNTIEESICFLEASKEFIKIDLIIWFQTSLIRDFIQLNVDLNKGYQDCLDQAFNEIYKKILKIKNISPFSKWVVIGGHAPIYNKHYYDWVDLLIEDWRSDLLNEKMPFCHSLGFQDFLERYLKYFGIEVLEDELKKSEIIIEAVKKKQPEIFFDGVHPSGQQNQNLANIILNHFLS